MKHFLDEFKNFAMKGNVVDLAVGVIMGNAFGKIVTSLVSDIVMPLLGLFVGRIDISSLSFKIDPRFSGNKPITVSYGSFLQTVLDFVIVAFSIFVMIKLLNKLRSFRENKEKDEEKQEAKKTEDLLAEILEVLKHKENGGESMDLPD